MLIVTDTVTSTGKSHQINLPVSIILTFNDKEIDSGTDGIAIAVGFRDLQGQGYGWKKDGSASKLAAGSGFTYLSCSDPALGGKKPITAVSDADPPVVSAANHDVAAGDTVRLINVEDGKQLSGIDFTAGLKTLTAATFSLDFMSKLAKAGKAGFYRKVMNRQSQGLKFITKIEKGASTVVTTSVIHGFTEGLQVEFTVGKSYGMTQLDGKKGIITAIDKDKNTFTVNIDSTNFTDFKFPATEDKKDTPAQVMVVGASGCKKGAFDQAVPCTGIVIAGGEGKPMGKEGEVIRIVMIVEATTSISGGSCCSKC
jgi:hypothetical protein